MSKPKDEALRALAHVIEQLKGEQPVEGLARHTLKATLEYAREQVALIAELKRPRKGTA